MARAPRRLGKAVRRERRSLAKYIREYTLGSQNPGQRRNYTLRDSQNIETTLFQMSGVFRQRPEATSNRIAGIGKAGT